MKTLETCWKLLTFSVTLVSKLLKKLKKSHWLCFAPQCDSKWEVCRIVISQFRATHSPQPDLRGENISPGLDWPSLEREVAASTSIAHIHRPPVRVWRLLAGTAGWLQYCCRHVPPTTGLEVSDLYYHPPLPTPAVCFLCFILQTISPRSYLSLLCSALLCSALCQLRFRTVARLLHCRLVDVAGGELSSITNHVHIIFLICSVFFSLFSSRHVTRNEQRHHPR